MLYEDEEKRRETRTKLAEKFSSEKRVKRKPFTINKGLFPGPGLKDLFKFKTPIRSSASEERLSSSGDRRPQAEEIRAH